MKPAPHVPGGRPEEFHKDIFLYFFIFLGYSIWNERLYPLSTHKRISVAINEEFGKLDYSKQDKERRRRKWEILCDGAGWGSQWCSEGCFGPSQREPPRQTAFSHGHVSGKLPICHMGIFLDCWSPHRHLLYFEVWGNKMDPASKVWLLLKSFPVWTSTTGKQMPPSPKKIPSENS